MYLFIPSLADMSFLFSSFPPLLLMRSQHYWIIFPLCVPCVTLFSWFETILIFFGYSTWCSAAQPGMHTLCFKFVNSFKFVNFTVMFFLNNWKFLEISVNTASRDSKILSLPFFFFMIFLQIKWFLLFYLILLSFSLFGSYHAVTFSWTLHFLIYNFAFRSFFHRETLIH